MLSKSVHMSLGSTPVWGAQRLNMVDLYGKNLRSYKIREAMVPLSPLLGSYDYMSVQMSYHDLIYSYSHNDHLNHAQIL